MGKGLLAATFATSLLICSHMALANGIADMTSDGRAVVWDAHRATFLSPGEAAIPLGNICLIAPATIVAATDGLVLYNGTYIMSAWFLDSAGHRWYFNEVEGCHDKGPVF